MQSGARGTAGAAIDGAVSLFEPVTLDELDGVLVDRLDTKYLLAAEAIPELLAALAGPYRVLDIDGERVHGYETVYFDTPAFDLYRAHHAGRPNRYKVRSRRYGTTGKAVLEVKQRMKRSRTVKRRMAMPGLVHVLDEPARSFIAEAIAGAPPATLVPRLECTFSRVTLADAACSERLTIDLDLAFRSGERVAGLAGVAVIERKRPEGAAGSAFTSLARSRGVRASAFSKYCIGVALVHEGIKHNRFNRQLARAERIGGREVACLVSSAIT
jgi:hypothetical protein